MSEQGWELLVLMFLQRERWLDGAQRSQLGDVPVEQGGAELAALLLCPLVRGGCPLQRWGQHQVSTGFTASL